MSRWILLREVALVFAMVQNGCGDDPVASPLPPVPDASAPDASDGGTGGCGPGEAMLEDGSCRSAGVPPSLCGEGFEPDGADGCRAVLPSVPCARGTMAIPGETSCREIAPCGRGTWGDIPDEPTNQYVDGSYVGADSDGTKERPWTSIQEGVDAAQADAVVAVAEGTYVEDVAITQHPVHLWGRCPALVHVIGVASNSAAVTIANSDSAEVRGLSLGGPNIGVIVHGAEDVRLTELWVRDTGTEGAHVQHGLSSTSVAITDSLFESARSIGILSWGSRLTVDRSVVRDTRPLPNGTQGIGVASIGFEEYKKRAVVTLSRTIVEKSRYMGLLVTGADLEADSCLVRDTEVQTSDGTWGIGVNADHAFWAEERPKVVLRSSVVENNHDVGVHLSGADGTLEATVVRDTRAMLDGTEGQGIVLERNQVGARTNATLTSVLVERNQHVGIRVIGSDVVMDGVRVRDTIPNGAEPSGGLGINIHRALESEDRSQVTMRASAVERSYFAGIEIIDSDVTIETTVVRDTMPEQVAQLLGDGIIAASDQGPPPMLTIRGSLVENNHECGVLLFDTVAHIEATTIRGTLPRPTGAFGDGVAVLSLSARASATVVGSTVTGNARAGILAFSADVALGDTSLTCNPVQLDGELSTRESFKFDDMGGNVCTNCEGVVTNCSAQTSHLSPPSAPPDG